ncbi:MAG: hypothetical protein ACE5K8_04350 [Candidatus Zixiibacteriota bacterium]
MVINWSKFRVLGSLVLLSAFLAPTARTAIELPKGKELQVVFEQDVSSKHVTPGQLIPIRLQGAIEVGGIEVVKDGAKGTARVKKVESARKRGKPGFVEVVLVELEPNGSYKAESDAKIQLEAITEDGSGTIRAVGKGRKTLSWILGFGFFIKGTEGVIPADKPFKAKVKEDINLLVE